MPQIIIPKKSYREERVIEYDELHFQAFLKEIKERDEAIEVALAPAAKLEKIIKAVNGKVRQKNWAVLWRGKLAAEDPEHPGIRIYWMFAPRIKLSPEEYAAIGKIKGVLFVRPDPTCIWCHKRECPGCGIENDEIRNSYLREIATPYVHDSESCICSSCQIKRNSDRYARQRGWRVNEDYQIVDRF